MISEALLENYITIIAQKTGIKIRDQDQELLKQKLNYRCKALGLNASAYYDLLTSSTTNKTQQEWQALAALITTGESYFFRDQGQLQVLRENILPAIIEHQKASSKITILSAGCSTGEEVYTLAILLRELLPDPARWSIQLIGVDINPQAIEKAQQGQYSEWSFRGVSPQLKAQYFDRNQEGWQVIEPIRAMANFYCHNLLQGPLPSLLPQSVNLILCRNVFIYFDVPSIAVVLEQFVSLLQPGGYLVTGHTELQEQRLDSLTVLSFAESIVYQRPYPLPVAPPIPLLSPAPISEPLNFWELAQGAFRRGQYPEAITLLQQWLALNPVDGAALHLMAQAYANQGHYERANQTCQQILRLDSNSIPALSLLAQIVEAQGDMPQAKDYLRRILFLAPHEIPAYLELLELHRRDGEQEQAQRLLTTVKPLVMALPATQMIPYGNGILATALLKHLQFLETSLY
ncbi:CheR family methyltransferase [Synechocystis sp. LKSZ1]|uniref:CheR family methyltransferase n=1 Tax=Synechocystis sp. LKSZ1 TaxID=3144951 RepID=UPI00336C1E18